MRNVHKGKPVAPLELERTWSCCVDAISFLTSLYCSSLLFLLFMLFLLKPLSTDAFCGAGPPMSACPYRHDVMSSGMQPRAVPCISVVSSLVSRRPLSCSGSHCRRALRRRGEAGVLYDENSAKTASGSFLLLSLPQFNSVGLWLRPGSA